MEFKLKSFKEEIDVPKIANIHYFEFTPEYHTTRDRHPFREIVYVDNGYIYAESENYRGKLKKNQMIIHKPNEVHSLNCPEDMAPSLIIIGFMCDSPELDYFSQNPVFLNKEQQSVLTDIIKEGRNVFLPPYDMPNLKNMEKRKDFIFGADQMIKLKLETLLITLIREKDSPGEKYTVLTGDASLSGVMKYITEHYKEKIVLNELCFLFGMNKTTLCEKFKDSYGDTVITYINKLKIKEAKKIMREGGKNFTEIAELTGFSSIHYFTRTFKKYENKTPGEYIKTIKSRLMM